MSGELKEILIQNGLQLLNEVGYQNFSIREVAKMSGVSHGAPYKHFKSKEELLMAISLSVMSSFKASLEVTLSDKTIKPNVRLAELGIKYVRYMAENPEHMKFLFLTSNKSNVKIKNNHYEFKENSPFAIFHKVATEYLDSIHADPDKYATDILSIWSVVHGVSVLIVEKSVIFEGDYLDYVSKMIYNRLQQ